MFGSRVLDTATGKLRQWLSSTLGALHVYGLAGSAVRVPAGTYNATDILGYRVSLQGTGTLTISPKSGAADITYTTGEVGDMVGRVYPEHLDSITVGTGMVVTVYIP